MSSNKIRRNVRKLSNDKNEYWSRLQAFQKRSIKIGEGDLPKYLAALEALVYFEFRDLEKKYKSLETKQPKKSQSDNITSLRDMSPSFIIEHRNKILKVLDGIIGGILGDKINGVIAYSDYPYIRELLECCEILGDNGISGKGSRK